MATSKIVFYEITKCTLTIEGTEYPVSDFRLELVEGGIPVLTVGINPEANPKTGEQAAPIALTVDRYLKWYNTAAGWCNERKKGTFVFTATPAGGGKPENLTLTNWVCVMPGFNRVSASASTLSAGVSLMHPICELECGSSHLFAPSNINIDTDEYTGAITQTSDVFDCMVTCIDLYAKAVDDTSLPAVLNPLKELYKKMLAKIREYFIWSSDGTSFPTEGTVSVDLMDQIKMTMWNYVSNHMAENPWTMIVNICTEWLLTVKPDIFSKKFEITPFAPWKTPKYTLDVEDLSGIELPSQLISPVLGCYIHRSLMEDITGASSVDKDPEKEDAMISALSTIGKIAHHPNAEKANAPLGCFKGVGVPEWFEIGCNKTVPVSSQEVSPAKDNTYTLPSGLDAAGADDALQMIVNQAYLLYHKNTDTIATVGRLMVKDSKGQNLVPGDRIKLGDLLSFYITGVTHSANVATKVVSTTINGRYLNTPGSVVLGGQEFLHNQVYI